MRLVRAFVIACVALSILIVPSTQAVAEEFDKDGTGPWLIGERVHMTLGCWGENAVGRIAPRLQANRNGKWATIAVAKMVNDARACTRDEHPLMANFYFTPKDRGVKDPESRTYWLTVRVTNRASTERYPVKIYASAKDRDLDWADENCSFSADWWEYYGPNPPVTREQIVSDCSRILGEPWKAWFAENIDQ